MRARSWQWQEVRHGRVLTMAGGDASTGGSVNPFAEREASAPSIIIRIQEVHRREEMPLDGGVVTPENIQMQPFRSKS